MPIYEYKCRKCNKKFEVFQDITDDEIKTCRFCEGKVDKLISLSSFRLKGSGWYVTDYGGKKPSSTETSVNEKSSADKSVGDGKACTAGETTPVRADSKSSSEKSEK